MDDDRIPHDVDRRVRAALAIDDAVSRRVLARALEVVIARPSRGEKIAVVQAFRPAVTGRPKGLHYIKSDFFTGKRVTSAIALIGVVIGLGLWRPWREAPASAPHEALRITSEGAVLVVESQDGRRWIVGSPPARPSGGNYVLVVPQ